MASPPVSRLLIEESLQFLLAWLLDVNKSHLNSFTCVFQAVVAANCPLKAVLVYGNMASKVFPLVASRAFKLILPRACWSRLPSEGYFQAIKGFLDHRSLPWSWRPSILSSSRRLVRLRFHVMSSPVSRVDRVTAAGEAHQKRRPGEAVSLGISVDLRQAMSILHLSYQRW
jgi:hypothetical protein